MNTAIFLLIVIVVLLCTPQVDRPRTLVGLLIIGGVIWLFVAFEIGDFILAIGAVLLAYLWEHRLVTLIFLAVVPYVGVFGRLRYVDHRDNVAIRKEWHESSGTVRTKFDERVKTLMSLGYDQSRAEKAAMRVANPKNE